MRLSSRVLAPTLEALPVILANCDAFLGLDSGAVHVAAAVGVPTVVLFGPQGSALTERLSPRSRVIIKDGFSYRPCDQKKCVPPADTYMDGIDVDIVYRALSDPARSKGVTVIAGPEREVLNRTSGRAQ